MSVEAVRRAYIEEGKDINETAKELGCNLSVLWAFIAKHKIVKDKLTFEGYTMHGDMA